MPNQKGSSSMTGSRSATQSETEVSNRLISSDDIHFHFNSFD